MPAPSRSNSTSTLSVEGEAFKRVADALKAELDGKDLRKDLVRELRTVARPVVAELRSSIRSAPSRQGSGNSPPLRATIARAIAVQVRATGAAPGVKIVTRRTPQARGFRNAPRALNARSFRHPVYGNRSVWRTQVGKPGWFDATVAAKRREFTDGAVAAIDAMAARIARRTSSR